MMNILYLEDEPQDAALVALYTRSVAHHLTVAGSVHEAQAALSNNPDLILVDVILGNTHDGYQFTRQMREEGYHQPIVAITALATARDQEECRRAGFDYVLTKPFTIHQLAQVIAHYSPG